VTDAIGKKLEAVEAQLEVAGRILGETGPESLSLGSDERVRALDAVCEAFGLVEELLGDTGNIRPVT